ncbi:MAG: hypothetical protein PHF50_01370 [Patescibacteria group bacterium]|nr:hypothetical protein [Patescibacteria group bacterium]
MNNIITVKRINNYLFWLASLVLVFIIISNFYNILAYATGIQQSGNTQIGGRIISVSPAGCQYPPPSGSGPDSVCAAVGCLPNPSVNGVIIYPFGYSATGFCPLMAMNTTLGPITASNVGYVFLGLFSGIVPGAGIPSIPLGMPGMARQ